MDFCEELLMESFLKCLSFMYSVLEKDAIVECKYFFGSCSPLTLTLGLPVKV